MVPAGPAVVDGLLAALSDGEGKVRQAAVRSLGQLEIKNETVLYRTLVALNRRLHDWHDAVREEALKAIRKLVEGRPLPGYQWTPLRVRRERREWWQKVRKLIVFGWTCFVIFAAIVIWVLIPPDPNSLPMQFIAALVFLIFLGAAVTQILDVVEKWWSK